MASSQALPRSALCQPQPCLLEAPNPSRCAPPRARTAEAVSLQIAHDRVMMPPPLTTRHQIWSLLLSSHSFPLDTWKRPLERSLPPSAPNPPSPIRALVLAPLAPPTAMPSTPNHQSSPTETSVVDQPKPMQSMHVEVPDDKAMNLRGAGAHRQTPVTHFILTAYKTPAQAASVICVASPLIAFEERRDVLLTSPFRSQALASFASSAARTAARRFRATQGDFD